MSINGMRFPPTAAAYVPPAAQGDAGADKSVPPGSSPGDAAGGPLSDRSPPRSREATIPPRAALGMLGAVQSAAAGAPPTPEAIAAKVRHQVAKGTVTLRSRHGDAVLQAALLVAARGLTALSLESRRPAAE